MKKNIVIIIFSVITFIAGFFSGYVYHKIITTKFEFPHFRHKKEWIRKRMRKELSMYLNLNKEQEAKIDEIIKKRREKMREIRRQFKPELEKLREETTKEIESILTKEQKEKFKEYLQKFKKRFKHKYNRGT